MLVWIQDIVRKLDIAVSSFAYFAFFIVVVVIYCGRLGYLLLGGAATTAIATFRVVFLVLHFRILSEREHSYLTRADMYSLCAQAMLIHAHVLPRTIL